MSGEGPVDLRGDPPWLRADGGDPVDFFNAETRGRLAGRALQLAGKMSPGEAGPFLAGEQIPVLPTTADKAPASHLGPRHGVNDATTQAAQAEKWWARAADLGESVGVAVATGPCKQYRHGLLVVDLDVKNGVDGVEAWNRLPGIHRSRWDLEAARGRTLTATTPSGGAHIFFTLEGGLYLGNSAGTLGAGIDIRGRCGYVCVAPSPGYEFSEMDFVAPVPDVVLGLLVEPAWTARFERRSWNYSTASREKYANTALEGVYEAMRGAPAGQRHEILLASVRNLVRVWKTVSGDLDGWLSDLRVIALETGMEEAEVERTIRAARSWSEVNVDPSASRNGVKLAAQALIDGWRQYWDGPAGRGSLAAAKRRVVAHALLDAADAAGYHRLTMPTSALAARAAVSPQTFRRLAGQLVGSMVLRTPGDGTKATEYELLDPPFVSGPPTYVGRDAQARALRGTRSANTPGEGASEGLAPMPPPWHDAFTSNGIGPTGWIVLEHLAGLDQPATTNAIRTDLAISNAAVTKVITALADAGAVEKIGSSGWTLTVTPNEAADLVAVCTGADGTRAARLGKAARETADRLRAQAAWMRAEHGSTGSTSQTQLIPVPDGDLGWDPFRDAPSPN